MKYNTYNMYYSCLRKTAFSNLKDALERAKKYDQRVYFCPLCGKYHLTKKRKGKENEQ